MNEKSTISTDPDRDDPPRFTREMADRGRHMVGDRIIRDGRPRGRPPKPEGERKEKVTLRLSPEVLAHFRAAGEGWQTRIDDLLLKHVRLAMMPKPDRGSTVPDSTSAGQQADSSNDDIVSMVVTVTERGGRRRRILVINPKTGQFVPLQSPSEPHKKRKAG